MTAPVHPVSAFLDGLTSGFQAGGQFRAARDDRRMALGEHADAVDYEKGRRLREQVGFELQQRVAQAQLDAATQKQEPQPFDLTPGSVRYDPTGHPIASNPKAPDSSSQPDYVKLGYDILHPGDPVAAEKHFLADRLRISRAGGGGDATRGQVTPKDLFSEKVRLMAPHWGPNDKGELTLMPGLSAADADKAVRQAAGTYQAPPVPPPTVQRGHAATGGGPPRMPAAAPQIPAPQGAAPPDGPTPADLERAKTDPGFAAWLKSKGYQVP